MRKISINQSLFDRVNAALESKEERRIWKKHVDAANEIVNLIENEKIKTTKDNYDLYLPYITDKGKLLTFLTAGAGEGARSAARINLGQ